MEEQMLEKVKNNIHKIDQLNGKDILSVFVGSIKRQNNRSSRLGAPILVKYQQNGEVRIKEIWVKSLEFPRKSYIALKNSYIGAESIGISSPIPKPYFYDENSGLLFMDSKAGINLINLTLRYCFVLNMYPNNVLKRLFYTIGQWLQIFQSTTETKEKTCLVEVIEELDPYLWSFSSFNHNEKQKISDTLRSISSRKMSYHMMPLVRPHNDLTLRNLFMQKEGGFSLVDWDAMVHPRLPSKALCWWDLTTLIINLQSMLRISPFISAARIENLCYAVIEGYFSDSRLAGDVSTEDFFQRIYYVYTLKYWLGIESDLPLSQIYWRSRGMGSRFVKKLRCSLVTGSADITI